MECTLGVANVTAFDFNIYPTVSNGNVTIDLPNSMESSLSIFNMLGQLVFTNSYLENKINLNLQLTSGIYLVKVLTDRGAVTKRIIIK